MTNGCPKCEKLRAYSGLYPPRLCIDCRLEQAENDVLRDMRIVEELKKEKEQHETQMAQM